MSWHSYIYCMKNNLKNIYIPTEIIINYKLKNILIKQKRQTNKNNTYINM